VDFGWKYLGEVGLVQESLVIGAVLDLVHEHVAGPSEALRRPDVEFPFRRVLALFQDYHIVRPGDFSRQRCEFFIVAVGLMKQLHSPEVSGGETGSARKFRL
jgi:hypothetical protein